VGGRRAQVLPPPGLHDAPGALSREAHLSNLLQKRALLRARNQKAYWHIPRDCEGETAFIIAGGPSVADHDLSRLKGRRVMVINSSYEAYPEAEMLFFGDTRWWLLHKKRLVESFAGKIITTAGDCPAHERLLFLRQRTAPGLTAGDNEAALERTSLRAAIDIEAKRGVKVIGLLGADMRAAPDGRTHHHTPHPPEWSRTKRSRAKDKYLLHMEDLRRTVEPLRQRGIQVFNCSPISLIDFWPKADFNELTRD
jgi:hypothetical protein